MTKFLLAIGGLLILTGCAPSNLQAPCPHYGFWCHKTPINGWATPQQEQHDA